MVPARASAKASGRVIRIGGAAALIPLLVHQGIDPDALVSEGGLSLGVFANPDNVVPFEALCRVVALAADRARLPDIGLRACTETGLRSLGTVGYLVAHSETVARGLAALQEYLYVHDQAATPFFTHDDTTAFLGYAILGPDVPGADQVTFGALAIAANIMRELCGTGFRLREVTIAYRAPAQTSLFRSFFHAPVRFGADRSALAFEVRWLATPIPNADPYLREVLTERIQGELALAGETTLDRIRRVIRSLVAGGKFGVDDAAAAFSVDRRTLARRLRSHGTDFREELDDARHASARRLLQTSELSIAEIAASLGYSDTTTFSRAFRRWSGTSPRACRRTS
jgi:AraC-like DNA-binding protein